MKRFGTFESVFTPCLLSILGVIMYLRLGWVVGQVGLWGALGIIVIANLITLATALSMSSIVTNIRIGAGGAHSIIAKSLGIEAGGAIGIPLYLSQAISVGFYIAGFTECWVSVFPSHDPLVVSLILWVLLLGISYYSTKLAFQLQYVIMGMIGLSLVAIFFGRGEASPVFGPGVFSQGYWKVFAIFFPAVTGILAGAAMSGEMKDPRRSIPRGTLAAIAVTFVVYVALAVWFAARVRSQDLVDNPTILLDLGRWKWPVIAGIMGATLSSALNMFVGSPRTLLALAKHSVVPGARTFSRVNQKGEPASAILVTSLIVLATILMGSLDSVANLLTMFFLITYGMINFSVFIEQSIGIASFRPAFRIPRFVPLFGGLACLGMMFLINAPFSLESFVVIVVIYLVLVHREIKVHSPDVRSGLLIFLAEQFVKAATKLPYHPKIWKPNLLVPVQDLQLMRPLLPFIRAVMFPAGRVFFFRIIPVGPVSGSMGDEAPRLERKSREEQSLNEMVRPMIDENLFVEASVVESADPVTAGLAMMQTLEDLHLPPNTFFWVMDHSADNQRLGASLINESVREGLGIMILRYHPERQFNEEACVNLWIRQHSPNVDLSILTALQLKENWEAHVRVIQVVDTPEQVDESRRYCEKLRKVFRLPEEAEIVTPVGGFLDVLPKAPAADINIFGMPEQPDFDQMQQVYDQIQTSVLFLRDSEHESAAA